MLSTRPVPPRRPLGLAFGAAALAATALMAACNLYSPFYSDATGDLDYRGLVVKGDRAINAGDYPAAQDYYERAMRVNPSGSEAYLKHAKAIMARYDLDYTRLDDAFKRKQGNDTAKGERGLPFLDQTTTVPGIDSVYYPVATAVRDLEHILRGPKDSLRLNARFSLPPDGDTAGDGAISEGVARLDLGLLEAVKGMLGPLDLDGNLHIDSACGRALCPAQDSTCMAIPAYKAMCREGPLSEVKRLQSFKKLTENIDISALDSKDVNARDVSTNPNDINAFLDAIEGPVAGSSLNLDSVDAKLHSHAENALSSQLSGVVGSVKDFSHFVGYMRYNDFIDNDYDSQIPPDSGTGTRMVWHDYDHDGYIRYNFDDHWEQQGYPPEAGDLGHPLHRYLKPEIYLTFAEWKRRFPVLAADTSKNSRIALMIKHCQDYVRDDIPDTGEVNSSLKLFLTNKTCSTYTTVLRADVRPPAHSEWLRGTAGVDEEAVDDLDNDFDGLKDEDARNAPGMDDDHDAALTMDMLGRDPEPMHWADVPSHRNACVDIDTLIPMDPQDPRRGCIGTLEHRLWLAHRGLLDSLAFYYSRFTNTEGADGNCLDDIAKLDPAFLARNGYTDADKNRACNFKHIWIQPRPPRSEWTGGTLGVDEEILDGIDNDGDGYIDEDVRAP